VVELLAGFGPGVAALAPEQQWRELEL